MNRMQLLVAIATIVAASPAMAQNRARTRDVVPPGQLPPAGMCRIWIDGLPPGQQAAATDCATAAARRPAGARLIFGPGATLPGRRVFDSDGQVVTVNGQKCVQRTDRNGAIRTVCRERDDDERDDHRLDARRQGDEGDRKFKGEKQKDGKRHKEKGKDGDRGDRGRNH